MKSIPHGRYVCRDQPQVLGDERQPTQLVFDGFEKLTAWTGHPASCLCSRCSFRHVPGSREATKMIQTNHVNVGQQGTQTGYPPTVAGLPKGIPVVDRIAPELSLRTEIIG